MLDQIPVVNLAEDRRRTHKVISRGLEEIGFVAVSAWPVTAQLSSFFETLNQFFSLPPAVKGKYARPDLHYQRGWTPPFTEKAIACRGKGPGGTDLADAKENWFMGPPNPPRDASLQKKYPALYASNIWPAEVPSLQPVMTRLYWDMLSYGLSVLRAVAYEMGKPSNFFDEMVQDGPTAFRGIHYPPISAEEVGKIVWGCQHTDINLATVLPAATQPGLWIRRRDGRWIPGTSPQGHVIVQVGDMLDRLTGGQLMSAAHEVRPPDHPTTKGRRSGALFIHPECDVLLDCEGRGPDAVHCPPILAGDFLEQRLQETKMGY